MSERLQKILSACGIGSRRSMEEYIQSGRVTVNGVTAALGDKAESGIDIIAVDGKPISAAGEKVYLMLNKPRGYVTTLSDEKGRKTVAELVAGCGVRVWPVGRLDLNSEGLLLLTNDGDLTYRIIHPSHEVEKEYLIWVKGAVEPAVDILSGPMELDGVVLSPAKVELIRRTGEDAAVLSITIHEGKNRQVRRMSALANLDVLRLRRIREGSLRLDAGLKSGCWRTLTDQELTSLQAK